MKNIFKLSLFTLGLVLSSNAMAATGSGHAQAELDTPLKVTEQQTINFYKISIDPAAGPQTVTISSEGEMTCPAAYVCTLARKGIFLIQGAPNTPISIDVTGATATLSDGAGHTLTFDPFINGGVESQNAFSLNGAGAININIGGSINFTGNENAGTYNATNAGGSGFAMTVNY